MKLCPEDALTGVDMLILFYADDGCRCGADPGEVQRALDLFTEGFARVGLKMNAAKTVRMAFFAAWGRGPMTAETYQRKVDGTAAAYKEYQAERIDCERCGKTVTRWYMPKHMETATCKHRKWRHNRSSCQG